MRKVRCEAFSDEEIVSVGARVGTHTFDTCGHDSPMSLFDMSPTLVACVVESQCGAPTVGRSNDPPVHRGRSRDRGVGSSKLKPYQTRFVL
jgi:hypothetical protein